MNRAPWVIPLGLAWACGAAGATVPSAPDSYVSPCIVSCPAGDSVFVLIARSIGGHPYPAGVGVLDLCGCPGLELAPVVEGGPYRIMQGCMAVVNGDYGGVTPFPLKAGGICHDATVTIYCDGAPMATRSGVATFDQNGDLAVTAADLSLITGKIGTHDASADFDCDGEVTEGDVFIATAHLGHTPSGVAGAPDHPTVALAALPIPNPSRGSIEFVLRAPAAGPAMLGVFDVVGRRQVVLLDRVLPAGVHRVSWSGRDESGRALPAGFYFYRFVVGTRQVRGSVVLTR